MDSTNVKEINTWFPISKLEKGFLLSGAGDITAGHEVQLPEIFTHDGPGYAGLQSGWAKAIRLLPEGTVLHKQDWFARKRFDGLVRKEDQGFLDRSSGLFFHERPYLEHHCYLFLTLPRKGKRPTDLATSNLLSSRFLSAELLDTKRLEEFENVLGQFVQLVSDNGMEIQRLDKTDYLGTSNMPGLLERYLFLDPFAAKPRVKDIAFKPELQIGSSKVKVFSLSEMDSLPNVLHDRTTYGEYSSDKQAYAIGQAAPLGQLLDIDHVYNQYVIVENRQAVAKQLESRALRMQSLANYSRDNLHAKEAIQGFLNESITEGSRPVRAHFNVLAWSDDPEGTKPIRNKVGAAFAKIDAVAKEESLAAPQLFWAGIPGNAAALPIEETFLTFGRQASCLFNMETGYISSPSPFGMRLGDRQTGKPVNVDLSDEPMERGWITNRNKFILGPSGSGKSFFTNHMVRSYHAKGAHVVLVDVGHSYRGLCELTGGYYFTYEEDHPICFNPFHLGGRPLDTEKKESIKTLLLALWKKDDETFTRSEYVAISNALGSYYEQLDTFPCFDSFFEFCSTGFKQQLEAQGVKDRDFDIDNFLYVLRPYYRGGEFDYLLNAKENLDLLEQRFIVFELDNIKDHPILFPVVTLIIMEIFISKMRKLKGVRKMILIEEAWKAIAKEGMAEYIKYLFKTVRKFFGEAVVVTQEVEDIISSPIIKQAIINNSDCKILLDQSKYRNKFDGIRELLGLTEKETMQIMSINKANEPGRKYKEVFIGLGPVGKVYRTEVSPEEYLAYTTEQKEKLRVQERAKAFGGKLEKGIAAVAAEMKGGQG
ncbi:conjugal transfer protein TraG [Echinicola strongylocentroti]|uniref:Conjugal transfer protein TraG n=1 Tax=Echinicola strongylocentroti TaxID=1795355 RepID=A0A2Z4IED0_9BACT|nr:TraG family conjugative transposon ATPase [Echinicola strongylocentroti]AWW29422.1 conjugal transfer protein TraG [Echinicola strongylocentroti]